MDKIKENDMILTSSEVTDLLHLLYIACDDLSERIERLKLLNAERESRVRIELIESLKKRLNNLEKIKEKLRE